MTAADLLRREEQRFLRSRYRNGVGIALAVLVVLGATFYAGVRYGRPSEQPADLRKALNETTEELRIVRAHADSAHQADSIATARVVAQRAKVATAARPIHVSPGDRDSTIVVERPAAVVTVGDTTRTTVVVDTITSLPLATYIRQVQLALLTDSLAMQVKDGRIRDLVHADSLAQRQDSLHLATEAGLEQKARDEHRRGFISGAKVGALLTGAALLAAKILIH